MSIEASFGRFFRVSGGVFAAVLLFGVLSGCEDSKFNFTDQEYYICVREIGKDAEAGTAVILDKEGKTKAVLDSVILESVIRDGEETTYPGGAGSDTKLIAAVKNGSDIVGKGIFDLESMSWKIAPEFKDISYDMEYYECSDTTVGASYLNLRLNQELQQIPSDAMAYSVEDYRWWVLQDGGIVLEEDETGEIVQLFQNKSFWGNQAPSTVINMSEFRSNTYFVENAILDKKGNLRLEAQDFWDHNPWISEEGAAWLWADTGENDGLQILHYTYMRTKEEMEEDRQQEEEFSEMTIDGEECYMVRRSYLCDEEGKVLYPERNYKSVFFVKVLPYYDGAGSVNKNYVYLLPKGKENSDLEDYGKDNLGVIDLKTGEEVLPPDAISGTVEYMKDDIFRFRTEKGCNFYDQKKKSVLLKEEVPYETSERIFYLCDEGYGKRKARQTQAYVVDGNTYLPYRHGTQNLIAARDHLVLEIAGEKQNREYLVLDGEGQVVYHGGSGVEILWAEKDGMLICKNDRYQIWNFKEKPQITADEKQEGLLQTGGTPAKVPEYEKLEKYRQMTEVFSSPVNNFTDWKKDAETPEQLAPGIIYQCEELSLSAELEAEGEDKTIFLSDGRSYRVTEQILCNKNSWYLTAEDGDKSAVFYFDPASQTLYLKDYEEKSMIGIKKMIAQSSD